MKTRFNYTFSLLLVLIAASNNLLSQNNLPTKVLIGLPNGLSEYPSKTYLNSISKETTSICKNEYWFVYSNAENVSIYDAPGGMGNLTNEKLKFLEPLVVVEKNGQWLHVASYGKTPPTGYPAIKGMTNKGWVKFDNVLVCGYAPTNKNALPQKAMTIIELSANSSKVSDLNNVYNIFQDPERTIVYKTNNGIMKAQANDIYYIFSEKNNSCLIGKISKLSTMSNEITSKTEILGWISDEVVQKLNTRICYEPSWTIDAQTEYSNESVRIFKAKQDALKYYQSGTLSEPAKEWKLNGKRMDGDIKRLFQLAKPNSDGTIDIGYIGRLASDNSGKTVAVGDEFDKLNKKLEEFKFKNSRLNIMIVIDGTSSMKNYFTPVANAAVNAMKSISGQLKNNDLVKKVKIGAVVYRDYADYSNKSIEVLPLSEDNSATNISSFLNGITCGSIDRGDEEAVYNGLITGIEQLPKGEKNVIIFIGDAANHKTDPKGIDINDVIKAANNKDVNFIVFQANNSLSHECYTRFKTDANQLVLETAKNFIKQANMSSIPKFEDLKLGEGNTTTRLDLFPEYPGIEGYAMFAEVTDAPLNKPIKPDYLQKQIENNINNVYDQVKLLLTNTSQVETTKELNPTMTAVLKNAGFSAADLDLLQKEDFRLKAWIVRQGKGHSHEGFLPVVFLEKEEFVSLLDILYNLTEVNGADVRISLYDAFVRELMKMYGGDKENDDAIKQTLNEKSLDQIWQDLFGIPFEYGNGGGNYALKELKDKNSVKDEWLEQFHSYMMDKHKQIKGYKNGYPCNILINGKTFYWIKREELP
jgi:hypothetical protein